jgi:hypothetical protein
MPCLGRTYIAALMATIAMTISLLCQTGAWANTGDAQASASQDELSDLRDDNEQIKSFNEVLQDLIDEFSFDLRAKALNGLRTVAVRRVALGEGIPRSYESYVETQVSDSFRKHSGTKVLQCTNCRVRRTVVENGRLVMTTPINNPSELDAIAVQLGVDAWLDVGLIYQETSMVLAFHVFDSKSKELVWTKLYNTENIYKKRMETRAVESSAVAQAAEADSNYLIAMSVGWHLVPNVKDSANMVGFTARFAEKFNDARQEVGTRVSYLIAPSEILSDYPEISGDPASSAEIVEGNTTEVILPFKRGVGLVAFYSSLLNGGRPTASGFLWSLETGAGVIASTGYASILARVGGQLRMGQRFLLDVGLAYSLPTTISIRKKYKYTTPGGLGADAAFGLHF